MPDLTCIKVLIRFLRYKEASPFKEHPMLTPSEFVATLAIWLLLAIGIFFGLRAAWRRRRNRRR